MLEKYTRENFIFSNIETFGSKPNLLHTKHFMEHLKDSDQIFYLLSHILRTLITHLLCEAFFLNS